MSVDVRTRTEGPVAPVDAAAWFSALPALAAAAADRVGPGANQLAPRPVAIVVDGEACCSFSFDDGAVVVEPGVASERRWLLTGEELSDLVHDVQTPMSFLASGRLAVEGGVRLEDTLDWWVILRAILDGETVHTPGAVTFVHELGATYQADASDEELAAYLEDVGYLHVAGVFTSEEMAAVSADMDAAAPTYSDGDGNSWWARTADGTNRLVRMQRFHEHSPTVTALLQDDRLRRFAGLTGDGHGARDARRGANVIEALVKPIGVVEGISDVPWHKDCSLGRHSYRCCSLTIGISVTGADETCGQLRVVAGSHRAVIQPAFVRRGLDLPIIDLPTATGDVTVHLSCTLHMAQPPVTSERRVLYTGFDLPPRGEVDHETLAKLSAIREGAHRTVSQLPAR
ncbi:MAG: phytanoyl-CoA dioxygenase family protein [Acidimicrobiales bacterium]